MKIAKTVDFAKIDLDLDQNSVIKQFTKQALSEGWTQDEINQISEEARSKPEDFDHFLNVLLSYANMEEIEEEVFYNEDEDEDYIPDAPYSGINF